MSQRDKKRTASELLWAWLKGDLRSREERDLYRAAEEDPFLNEALQGYEHFPEGKHVERIHSIKSKLKKQKRRGIILPLRIAAVAASVLIVAVSMWWIIQPQNDDLASAESIEQAKELDASTVEKQMTPVVADEQKTREPEPAEPIASEPAQKREKVSPKPQIEKKVQPEPELAEIEKEGVADMEELAMDVVPAPPPPVSPAEAVKPVPPPAREESVAAGQAAAKKKDVQEEMALREYEETRSSARSRRIQAPNAYMVPSQDMETQTARPVGGFFALENYLDSAWQKPWLNDTSGIAAQFIGLEFQVLKDGTLTNFLITDPSTPKADSSFIQLLRQGPKWEYVNPDLSQPVRVQYRYPQKK